MLQPEIISEFGIVQEDQSAANTRQTPTNAREKQLLHPDHQPVGKICVPLRPERVDFRLRIQRRRIWWWSQSRHNGLSPNGFSLPLSFFDEKMQVVCLKRGTACISQLNWSGAMDDWRDRDIIRGTTFCVRPSRSPKQTSCMERIADRSDNPNPKREARP